MDQLVQDQVEEEESQAKVTQEDDDDDKDIVDVGEDYVVDERVATPSGGKYNLEPGAIVLEGMDFQVDPDPRGDEEEELGDEGEVEKELEEELERIHATQEEEEPGIMEEEERMGMEEELNAEMERIRTPTPMPQPHPHLSAGRGEMATPRKTPGSSKPTQLEPELEPGEVSENVDDLIEQG